MPTLPETTKPARAEPGREDGNRWTTMRGVPARRPVRTTAANSSAVCSRAAAGSTSGRFVDELVRPTARRGPCGVGRPKWPGRRGSACAAGNRASWPAGGCSAGRCACSRSSPVTSVVLGSCRFVLVVLRQVPSRELSAWLVPILSRQTRSRPRVSPDRILEVTIRTARSSPERPGHPARVRIGTGQGQTEPGRSAERTGATTPQADEKSCDTPISILASGCRLVGPAG